MFEMSRLIRNEWMKIFKRNSTYILIAILMGAVFLFAFVSSWSNNQQSQSMPWEEQVSQQMNVYEQQAAQSENMEEKIYYQDQVAIAQHRLEEDIPPPKHTGFTQYLLDSKSNITFAVLFTVIIASGIVASEFTWGTIKLLTIRPVKRGKILWAKYFTTLLFSLTLALITYLAAIIGGMMFLERGDGVLLTMVGDNIVEQSVWIESLRLYGLAFVNMIIMTSFAFMIGTLSRSNALAIGLSIFLMFTGQQLVFLFQEYAFVKFYLFTHTDFSQYLQPNPMIEGISPLFSVTVLMLYLIVFLLVSHFSFTKRDIAT
ncbi:ABC-2 type transport system permease protein [Thalassobacillus cyri]|uniref:ABC-2 type transport system permease protein n=2 Tax=Thalassobacillus cyri TaxID=571932 RepID=A0A1H4G669_9BACI|nr:ABC-2 type transport system permease protein [Thalassobacillus cyri]